MKYRDLLHIVGQDPVFETGLLLSGAVDPAGVQRQLSRWTASGRLHQLRRGVYALAPPYRKVVPHPFLVANRLVRGSYVSLQSALAYYGLIPEHVPVTTSVTTARQGRWETPLGVYTYRHIKSDFLYGYRRIALGQGQHAFLATPEKALLDLVYLEPEGNTHAYLEGLRLQHLDQLDLDALRELAERVQRPKLRHAAARIAEMARAEAMAYEPL